MRKKKDGVFVNVYMGAELKDKLTALADENHQTFTGALEMILAQYFAKREAEQHTKEETKI